MMLQPFNPVADDGFIQLDAVYNTFLVRITLVLAEELNNDIKWGVNTLTG